MKVITRNVDHLAPHGLTYTIHGTLATLKFHTMAVIVLLSTYTYHAIPPFFNSCRIFLARMAFVVVAFNLVVIFAFSCTSEAVKAGVAMQACHVILTHLGPENQHPAIHGYKNVSYAQDFMRVKFYLIYGRLVPTQRNPVTWILVGCKPSKVWN